jgi:hypothetical protein
MSHACATLLVALFLTQSPPFTGPRGDPSKGPPIVTQPPAEAPPSQQPGNNRERDRQRDDGNNRDNNRDNTNNDTARQRRVIELRRASESLRQQLTQLDASLVGIENDFAAFDRLLGNALYDTKVARAAARAAAEHFNALVMSAREALQTQTAAAQEFAAVYGRLRERMERTPELSQAMSQVLVATQARAEARAKAITELARTDEHKKLIAQRQGFQETLDRLRSQSGSSVPAQTQPAAPTSTASSSPSPDDAAAGPPTPLQDAATGLLRTEAALAELEKPALERDPGFQEADAVYDTVTKRLNIVRAQVEQEWRNDPERVAAQRLVDDTQNNVKAARARIDEQRTIADDTLAAADRAQAEVVKLDNWRRQRYWDRSELLRRRGAIISELDAIERELAGR